MNNNRFILIVCATLMLCAAQAMADQCTPALPVGTATGCGVLITVTSVNGSGDATAFHLTFLGNGNPYDGSEDTLVGIQNSAGGVLNDITFTGAPGSDIFGFDGDGPCTFNPADCFGPTGYEGPDNTFTGISIDLNTGTVSFTVGLDPGTGNWFALEGNPQQIVGTTPEPMSLLLLGSGLLTVALRRRKA
jgi:hypothetical protein